MGKVKCFACQKFRHYANQCPNKKKGKGKPEVATFAEVDEFSTRFEREFSLVTCLSRSMANSVWYIDTAASCHMTGARELFTSLSEKDLDLDIELGDNAKYKVMGLGTVSFWKEFEDLLEVKDVLYVPGLTKNLLLVSTMEDKGYVATFQDG